MVLKSGAGVEPDSGSIYKPSTAMKNADMQEVIRGTEEDAARIKAGWPEAVQDGLGGARRLFADLG